MADARVVSLPRARPPNPNPRGAAAVRRLCGTSLRPRDRGQLQTAPPGLCAKKRLLIFASNDGFH